MFSKIKSLLFFSLVVISLLSCEKEYSIEAANPGGGTTGGTSKFTLDGAPGACNGATVQGSYKAGVATTALNNVILTVNVTDTGTYIITTNVADGFSFASSGTFTQLGFQIIQLNAIGTPAKGGTINFSAGAASCSFPVVVTDSTGGSGGGGTVSGTSQYVLNGNPGACQVPAIEGTYQQGTALNATNKVTLKANVTKVGTYTITTTNNGMTFNATGAFTTIGANQDIVFTGSGTPTAAGDINFGTGVPAVGCTFTIPVTATGGGGTVFLKATVDGLPINFNTNLSGTGLITPTPGISSISIKGDSSAASTSPNLQVNFISTTGSISTGAYENLSLTNTSKGMLVIYNVGSEVYQSSLIASTFSGNLTTYTSNTATGTFSGKLYNNSGSGPAFKTFTAGSFSITY